MTALVLRRLVLLPVGLLVTSAAIFVLPRSLGGDVARAVIRARSTSAAPDPVEQDRLAHELGLDRSIAAQYADWLLALLRGDLGTSFTTRTPVAAAVGQAAAVSLGLTLLALGVAVLVGVPAGAAAAARAGGVLDRVVRVVGAGAFAVPEFVLGPVLVLLLAVGAGWLPALGWGSAAQAVLPTVTLAAFPTALVAQLVRVQAASVLADPATRTARAKGLTRRRALAVHVVPRASTAALAALGPLVGGTVGGAVVVEVVFAVPGLGRLLAEAVAARDLPVVQAGLLLAVGVATLAALATEAAHRALDPRLRTGGTA